MNSHLIFIGRCLLLLWSICDIANGSGGLCNNGPCANSDINLNNSHLCLPGRFYCAEQLASIHFNAKRMSRSYLKHTLVRCRSDGMTFDLANFCLWQCASQPDGDAYCKCQENKLFCGHKLHEMRWNGLVNNTLYLCSEGGGNVNTSFVCPGGICKTGKTGYCPCEPDHTYCSDELQFIGYFPKYTNSLYRCDNDSKIMQITECDICVRQSSGIYCPRPCVPGQRYCGHILYRLGWRGYKNDTVYLCETRHNIKELLICPGECDGSDNACSCLSDQTYCGHELAKQLGWSVEVDKYELLYQCTNGKEVAWVDNCERCVSEAKQAHCSCEPGTRYCGSLLKKIGWAGFDDNKLYHCDEDGRNVTVMTTCPGECESTYCHCIPGKKYCGHELVNLRFRSRLSRHDLQNLYLCDDGTNAEQIAQCGKCDNRRGKPYCSCKAPHQYCGHMLDGSGDLFENNTIYSCRWDAPVLARQTCARTCIQDGSLALCAGECTPNRRYCDATLNSMGWQNRACKFAFIFCMSYAYFMHS